MKTIQALIVFAIMLFASRANAQTCGCQGYLGGSGAQCGTITDNCGNQINCGTCPNAESCNTFCSTDNDCYKCCASCQSLGNYTCGQWSDGCGDSIYCGSCPQGQMCSVRGQCVSLTLGTLHDPNVPTGQSTTFEIAGGPVSTAVLYYSTLNGQQKDNGTQVAFTDSTGHTGWTHRWTNAEAGGWSGYTTVGGMQSNQLTWRIADPHGAPAMPAGGLWLLGVGMVMVGLWRVAKSTRGVAKSTRPTSPR